MSGARSQEQEADLGASWRESVRSAVAAGAIYSCLLLSAGMLCGATGRLWLSPLVGEAAAFAAELTIMLPLTCQYR
jgi:hypothetical protein